MEITSIILTFFSICIAIFTLIIAIISICILIKNNTRKNKINNTINEIRKSYQKYQNICPYPNSNYGDIFSWFYDQDIIDQSITSKLLLKELVTKEMWKTDKNELVKKIIADKTMNNIYSTLNSLQSLDIDEIKKDFVNLNKKINYIEKVIINTNIFDKEMTKLHPEEGVFLHKYWLYQKMYISLVPGKNPFFLKFSDKLVKQRLINEHIKNNINSFNKKSFEIFISSKMSNPQLFWWKISWIEKDIKGIELILPSNIWNENDFNFAKEYDEETLLREIKELKNILMNDNILNFLKINKEQKEWLLLKL